MSSTPKNWGSSDPNLVAETITGTIHSTMHVVPGPVVPGPFQLIAKEIGDLVTEKNKAYGNAFSTAGEALKLLYPNGILPEQYHDALALVRIWDKCSRIATDRDALGESPFRDIAGYGILGTERVERVRKGTP